MYSACVKCDKLGSVCKGPNFMDMTVPELIDWLKIRKAHLGWTNATLAAKSSVPVGTINRLLGGATDFKYESIRPLLRALTGSSGAELPCPDPEDTATKALRERVRHLEQELTDTKAISDRESNHLHNQIRNHRIALSLITGVLILVLLAIIGVLVFDITHEGIGYFGR